MVSPLWSWNGVGGVLRTIFRLKQSPTSAMYPSSSRRDWMLAPGSTPAPARRSRSCSTLGSYGIWRTLFEIKHGVPLYVSVRNSDPAGIRARARFLENDKPGRGMASPGLLKQPNDRNRGPTGDSRWRSGSAHPGWAVLGVNATPP